MQHTAVLVDQFVAWAAEQIAELAVEPAVAQTAELAAELTAVLLAERVPDVVPVVALIAVEAALPQVQRHPAGKNLDYPALIAHRYSQVGSRQSLGR